MQTLAQTPPNDRPSTTRVRPKNDWPPIIRPIEADPAIARRLEQVGRVLDDAAATLPDALSLKLRSEPVMARFRAVLAQLGSAHAIRVLHWLAETDLPETGGLLARLLNAPGPDAAALRAMVDATRRSEVMARIMAPERLALIEAVCGVAGSVPAPGPTPASTASSTTPSAIKEIA